MISFKKAVDLIEDSDIKYGAIRKGARLSWDTLAKLKKDEPVNLNSLDRLANYLSKELGRDIQPGDLMEFR